MQIRRQREGGSAVRLAPSASMRMVLALAALLTAALIALVPSQAHAAPDTSWYYGHESESTFTVADANQLQGLAALVNGGVTFEGKTVRLGALPGAGPTLRLSGEWTPIGTASHPFNGTFDGNKGSISSLTITRGNDGVGLFGYAGAASQIKDLTVSGSINLSQPATSAVRISNVGGIVGSTGGSVTGCTSSMVISVYSAVPVTEKTAPAIKGVGAIGGVIRGAVSSCTVTSRGSVKAESPAAPPSIDVPWVIESVGGIVGIQGPDPATDLAALKNAPGITDCSNAAPITVLAYATGPNDRFGNPTYATANFEGGIAGWASGSIINCKNTGGIDSAYLNAQGQPSEGYGCRGVGGIVGGFRVDNELTTATDIDDPGLRYNKQIGGEALAVVKECTNTADVFGLAQSGGIVGQAGSYTSIEQCVNSGAVEASRFTKPSPGGVVGRTYGDISYCINSGQVTSTTGGGYYAGGIVGMFHSIGADASGTPIEPEMYACYNTGHIMTSSKEYRAGSLVGELDGGYIHDCMALENLCYRNDVSGLDSPTGTIANCPQIPQKEALAASTIALLNGCADNDGWKCYFTLPAGASYGSVLNSNGTVVGPQLVKGDYRNPQATDLSRLSGTVTVTQQAAYSVSMDPVPTATVTLSNGRTLVQNADFRIIAQSGSAGAAVGTSCTGTVAGIGIYAGNLPQKVSYSISKGPISSCTVTAEAKYFNWSKQKPDTVTVRDASGNVVDPSEYTWTVDSTLFNGSTGAYRDAIDQNSTKYYPITVTAKASGNYEGSQTANVFKIIPVGLASNSMESQNPNQSTLKAGTVTWGDQSWDFNDVCDFDANGGMGSQDKKGVMQIKYTGQPIKPQLSYVSYMGQNLKQANEDTEWWNNPKEWGYMVLYGNPNPELGTSNETLSNDLSVVNATRNGTYAAMTVRAAPLSNFDNYVTVWFTILPADLTSDVTMGGTFHDTVPYNGYTAEQNDVVFTYNGMTLQQGKDYLALYEKGAEPNTMTVTYQGIGNYTGTITRTYKTTGSQGIYSDVAGGEWFVNDGSLAFVTDNGIMGASGGTTQFLPYYTTNRAMVATVLYRIATGNTSATTDNYVESPFTDVPTGKWYTAAIAWAQKNGIVTGYGGTTRFGPTDPVTRQQLGTMIARFAAYMGCDTAADANTAFSSDLSGVNELGGWSKPSMAWCVSQGIFNNYGYLNPQGSATRCQLAKVLRVACTKCIVVSAQGKIMTLGEAMAQGVPYTILGAIEAEPAGAEDVADAAQQSADAASDEPATEDAAAAAETIGDGGNTEEASFADTVDATTAV